MIYEKVASQFGDWGEKFRPFIESKDFDDIFAFLKKESREGKIICPAHADVFRAFKETPYSKIRVIFLLQDPYPWVKNNKFCADGIAMSSMHTGICQPSLDLFYDGMADDLGQKVVHHPDLTYLANQGVLFLNTSLTVELNKPNSHKDLWNKFIDYLIQNIINFHDTEGIIYVSLGKNAEIVAKAVVPFLHYGLVAEHPAAAAHKQRPWDHNKVFTKINKILKDNKLDNIIWDYEQYRIKSAVNI